MILWDIPSEFSFPGFGFGMVWDSMVWDASRKPEAHTHTHVRFDTVTLSVMMKQNFSALDGTDSPYRYGDCIAVRAVPANRWRSVRSPIGIQGGGSGGGEEA